LLFSSFPLSKPLARPLDTISKGPDFRFEMADAALVWLRPARSTRIFVPCSRMRCSKVHLLPLLLLPHRSTHARYSPAQLDQQANALNRSEQHAWSQ
jgi:hypothetical protein